VRAFATQLAEYVLIRKQVKELTHSALSQFFSSPF